MMKPNILVAGILDTKGAEFKYLTDRIIAAGGNPIVVELSMGRQMDEYAWVNYHSSYVLNVIGKTLAEVQKMQRVPASEIMTAAASALAVKMAAEKAIDGIIGYGGGVGTQIVTAVMRSLPVGLPKLMLSSFAANSAGCFGTKDICLMYPLFEAGLNHVSRKIINNAAYGIVGMANGYRTDLSDSNRPTVGLMMQGVTTPCVLRAAADLEAKGFETMICHATGDGGKIMEELISDGFVAGFLDLNLYELVSELHNVRGSAGPDRLRSATRKGIPHIIAPGGLDIIIYLKGEVIPADVRKEIDSGKRGLYAHAPEITIPGSTPEEAYKYAAIIAGRINDAVAPTAILVPLRGWSSAEAGAPGKEIGWTGEGASSLWLPATNRPEWSQRSLRFIDGLKEYLNWENLNIEVYSIDTHLNDHIFADFAADLMEGMLAGNWKKGGREKEPGVTYVHRTN